jgi:hypothetical protein
MAFLVRLVFLFLALPVPCFAYKVAPEWRVHPMLSTCNVAPIKTRARLGRRGKVMAHPILASSPPPCQCPGTRNQEIVDPGFIL